MRLFNKPKNQNLTNNPIEDSKKINADFKTFR